MYPAEKEKMWLFAVEFTTILKEWNRILDSYNYNDNDEYKKKHGTDCAFIVEIDWYNKFARYAQLSKAEEPKYQYYGTK